MEPRALAGDARLGELTYDEARDDLGAALRRPRRAPL